MLSRLTPDFKNIYIIFFFFHSNPTPYEEFEVKSANNTNGIVLESGEYDHLGNSTKSSQPSFDDDNVYSRIGQAAREVYMSRDQINVVY